MRLRTRSKAVNHLHPADDDDGQHQTTNHQWWLATKPTIVYHSNQSAYISFKSDLYSQLMKTMMA
ncbi:hypothetical protein BLOT_014154 [Blomia tropicalis]|nr:hypothetical protein BLOT_014154 [Blomia tropicalis]